MPNIVQHLRYNILIVDDQITIRYMLREFMAEYGYGYFEAWDRQSAFRILAKEQVDLAMLDIMLERENGLDILRKIHVLYPDVVPLMMTGVEELDAAIRAMRSGAVDYIRKPFNLNEVRLRLEQALEKRRNRQVELQYIAQLEQTIRDLQQRLEKETPTERSNNAA